MNFFVKLPTNVKRLLFSIFYLNYIYVLSVIFSNSFHYKYNNTTKYLVNVTFKNVFVLSNLKCKHIVN